VGYPHVGDPRPGGGLGPFYGLRRGESDDLRYKRRVFAGRLPDRLMAFASSPGGQMCLSLHGEDAGCVYWWERNAPLDDPDFPLLLVAHDFDSFMNSIVWSEEFYDPPELSEEAGQN
jgi:SMI1 / KNR4 family (SUKH-1)